MCPDSGNSAGSILPSSTKHAWKMWTEVAKMILNEYRLNLASPEAQKFLFEQAEKFFFGPGAALPPDYVPQASKK